MKITTQARFRRALVFATQKELAAAAKVDIRRYSYFERGETGRRLKPDEVDRIALVLMCAPEDISDVFGRPLTLSLDQIKK